jgi:O-antigen ligase
MHEDACGRALTVVVAITLVAPHPVVLSLYALWAAFVWWRHGRTSHADEGGGITSFTRTTVVLLLGALVSVSVHPVDLQGLRLVAWFGLAALIVGAVRVLPSGREASNALGWGATWGASLAGVTAMIDVGVLGASRAEGFTGNAIVFGNLALVLGAVAWWLGPRRWTTVAVVMAGVASVLSGSRGGWIALPVLAGVALVDHRRRAGTMPLGRVGAAALCAVAAVVVMGGGMPVERLQAALDDVTDYVGAEAPEPATGTSIGARFEAWRAAGDAALDHPLLGVGWGNLDQVFDAQVADGSRHPRIATFTHAHHHLLGALASAGIVGLMTHVAVLALPAWWFRRAWRSNSTTARQLGGLGLAVVGAYVVFGQTEAIFDDGIAVAVYALVVAVVLRHLDDLVRRRTAEQGLTASPR